MRFSTPIGSGLALLLLGVLPLGGLQTPAASQPRTEKTSMQTWRHANMNMPDPTQVAAFAATGADALLAWCTGRDGTFHPSQLAPLSPMAKNPDVRFREWVQAVHARNLKAIGYIAPLHFEPLTTTHPEWFQQTEEKQLFRHGPHAIACLNTGYRDWLVELLVEIASLDHLDMFWADGWQPVQAACHCASCVALYQRETGRPIPRMAEFGSLAFRQYLDWRDRHVIENVRYVQAKVRERCPWVRVIGNYSGIRSHSSLPFAERNPLAAALDWPSLEVFYESSDDLIYPHLGLSYMRNGARGKPIEAFLWSSTYHFDRTAPSDAEALNRLYLCLTEGAAVQPSLAPGGLLSRLKALFAAVTARLPWIEEAVPEPYAGVVISENTIRHYGDREPAKRVLASQFGIYRALLEEHIPVTALADEDLTPERLAAYRVIILPETRCLSAASLKALQDYVHAGGAVVATGGVGLLNEEGEARNGDTLETLFGIRGAHPLPEREGLEPYRLKKRPNTPISSPLFDSSVWHKDILTPAEQDGTAGFAGLVVSATASTGQVAYTIFSDSPDAALPALVTHTYGKGRTAWFGAEVGRAYHEMQARHLRGLIGSAVRWAGGPLPVETQAPAEVVVKTWRQPDHENRRIIHLLNHARFARSPLPDISLGPEPAPPGPTGRNASDSGYSRADTRHGGETGHVAAQGVRLAIQREKDGCVITVPILQDHAMIVLEAPPPK